MGVPIQKVKALAKEIKKDQDLSLQIWETGIHECRILASMVGDPKLAAPEQMDSRATSIA